MRIVGGTFRGRRLAAPKGGTRPTTDRTREAVFNLVMARMDLHGARVLDLFAGSGALGLEALSRGAAHATFVEQSAAALAVIRANAASLGVEARCALHRADAVRFLRGSAPAFDLVLADPPYDLAAMEEVPDLALRHLAADGLLVLEHDRSHTFGEHPAHETSRRYGQTVVSLFRGGVENA